MADGIEDVELRRGIGRIANEMNLATVLGGRDRAAKRSAADDVQRDIGARPTVCVDPAPGPVAGAVVDDDCVGAQRFDPIAQHLMTRHGDDTAAAGLRQLQCCHRDAAAAQNDKRFAGP